MFQRHIGVPGDLGFPAMGLWRGQGAAGEDANLHHRDAMLPTSVDQVFKVRGRSIRPNQPPGGGIEQVVIDLGRGDAAGGDQFLALPRITQGGEANMVEHPLGPQFVQTITNPARTKPMADIETVLAQRIVQLIEIDPRHAQAL